MNTPEQKVIINDITLSDEQLNEFEKIYGQRPDPGQYWYDKINGMFGIFGQPALGYLQPGHEYGTLQPNASNGNTGVFINKRELSQPEYVMLCQLIGSVVFPASYWLDAQGNAGLDGNPLPIVNLMAAAQQHAQQGIGADNFWSSRHAAGNSTSDGSAGYINLGDGTSATWGM